MLFTSKVRTRVWSWYLKGVCLGSDLFGLEFPLGQGQGQGQALGVWGGGDGF